MPKPGAIKIGTDKMRSPRAHVQTVVFTFGARKKQELPFVIGVMADLSGKPAKPLPAVSKREFLDIDSGNFEGRMAAIRPRAAFQVPNPLKKGEMLPVDLEFESVDDFKPDRVAQKVKPLRDWLEQRERLDILLKQLDGPNSEEAERIFQELLQKVDALSKGNQ
jgi:type VI secretion system protein ImpB